MPHLLLVWLSYCGILFDVLIQVPRYFLCLIDLAVSLEELACWLWHNWDQQSQTVVDVTQQLRGSPNHQSNEWFAEVLKFLTNSVLLIQVTQNYKQLIVDKWSACKLLKLSSKIIFLSQEAKVALQNISADIDITNFDVENTIMACTRIKTILCSLDEKDISLNALMFFMKSFIEKRKLVHPTLWLIYSHPSTSMLRFLWHCQEISHNDMNKFY